MVEGEKDADRLEGLGFLATTNPGGAGKWRGEYTKILKDHPVVIIPDNDDAGREHALQVARKLLQVGCQVRILELDVPEKGDVSVWFNIGHTAEELRLRVSATKPLDTKSLAASTEKWIGEEPDTLNTADSESKISQPILSCAAEIEPQEVEWLWKPYIPLGKLTVISGNPGVGKSFFALTLAAIVSSGHPFPNLETGFPDKTVQKSEPAPVVYASVEDAPDDTLVPRLIPMNATRENIYFFNEVRKWDEKAESWVNDLVSFENLAAIEGAFKRTKCRLAIFDPIQGFGGKANMNYSHEVRKLLAPLAVLAEKYHVAIFMIAHPRKAATDRALQRMSGSVDIGAAARSVLMAGNAPQKEGDERAIVHIKSNLAKNGPSLGYAIEDDGKCGEFRWTGVSDLTAGDLLASEKGPEKGTALDEAVDFLDILNKGPMEIFELKREAESAGITWATLKRAKRKLGVTSEKTGGRGAPWCWVKKGKGTQKSIYGELSPLYPTKGPENPAITESRKGDQGSTQEAELRSLVPFGNDEDIEFIEP